MLNIYSLIDWTAGFAMFIFVLILYNGTRTPSSRAYALYSASTGLWAFAMGTYIFIRPADYDAILIALRILYWTGISTPTAFHYFSIVYRNETPNLFWKRTYIAFCAITFYFYVFTDALVTGVQFGPRLFDRFPVYNWTGFIWFNVVYTAIVTAAFLKLWRHWRDETNLEQRRNNAFLFWGGLTAWWPPTILSIVLVNFQNFDWYWIAPPLSALWIFAISYAIFKHRLFPLRVIGVELLIVLLLIILFLNIFVPDLGTLFPQ